MVVTPKTIRGTKDVLDDPNAATPSTPVGVLAVAPPQTPVMGPSVATVAVSPAQKRQLMIESYGLRTGTASNLSVFAPNLSEVPIYVGTTIGVDPAGNSKFKAFATIKPNNKNPDKLLVKGLTVGQEVDFNGVDKFNNKNKIAMKNRGANLDMAEQNLVRNVTLQILHVAYEKQTPKDIGFPEYAENAKNCISRDNEIIARTAYQGCRFVRRCADNSIEFLPSKGKISPEMNFDAELTFSYWKYKGNYGVSAAVHRIIVNTAQEQGQASFLSGATEYGHGQ